MSAPGPIERQRRADGSGGDGAEQLVVGRSEPPAGQALAERVAAIASERKALDIRLVDLRQLVAYTDTLVVCSGNTERQTKAVHDAIHQTLKDEYHLLPRRVEGQREARWILMDYLDCVVHIFTPEAREFYRIEQLWGEAPARSVE